MADPNTSPHVSDDQLVYGWHVAVIIIGVAITMPAFLVGAELMSSLGTQKGILAIGLGGLILSVIASACMYIAVSKRLTTYQILDASFGRLGSRIVSFLISLTLLGWFGVTASLFGQAVGKSVEDLFSLHIPTGAYIALGCAGMTLTTIYGFRAIDILSKYSVPMMMIILISGVYFISSNFTVSEIWNAPAAQENTATFGGAVSAVVGSFMVGLTIVPDIARFINRKRQVHVASVGSYGSFFTIILIAAGLPGLMTGERDLIVGLYEMGLGVPALIMIIFASWTTNINNLYSCSLGFSQVAPRVKSWQVTVISGVIGTVFALSGIVDHLIDFLLLLSIFIPPVAGIYIAHFFSGVVASKTAISVPAITSWMVAATIAFLTSSGVIHLTTIPALDSLFIAMILYLSLTKVYACLLR